MKRLAAALMIAALGSALPGCGSYTPEGEYGYRARRDEVRFSFRPRRYPWAAIAATGDSVPMRDLRVRRVAVWLLYADGEGERLAMDDGESGFTLRVRRERFRDRPLRGFAFLVNDRFVALPPPQATNRIESASGVPVLLTLGAGPTAGGGRRP